MTREEVLEKLQSGELNVEPGQEIEIELEDGTKAIVRSRKTESEQEVDKDVVSHAFSHPALVNASTYEHFDYQSRIRYKEPKYTHGEYQKVRAKKRKARRQNRKHRK